MIYCNDISEFRFFCTAQNAWHIIRAKMQNTQMHNAKPASEAQAPAALFFKTATAKLKL